MNGKPEHATITMERSYPAPPARVFSEFADPLARARWSPPSGDVLIYDEADFRAGGRDLFRCGPQSDPKFRGETLYHLIVPNERVISSEILDVGDHRLAVSLTTLDFASEGNNTKLTLTVQMISLAGQELIDGYRSGNKSALENLASHLGARP